MKTIVMKLAQGAGLGAAAFASDALVDPAPAGAHCGGHAGSCGYVTYFGGEECHYEGGVFWRVHRYDEYALDCSGTCYNAGTQGCCASAEACADAPCKPGGCGAACGDPGSWYQQVGLNDCST